MRLPRSMALAAALVAVSAAVWTPHAAVDGRNADKSETQEEGRELDPRDVVDAAALSLVDAIAAALEVRSGAAVEAELEGTVTEAVRTVAFEVDIVGDDGQLHEVRVDSRSGEVVGTGLETDPDDAEELRRFERALRHTELSLADLVARAGEIVHGTAVAAELELEGGHPVVEVVFVAGRYVIEAEVEARAGHLIELELEEMDDEDDEHGHDDRHG